MAHFIDTPRTERGDATRLSQTGIDFTELESFQAPAGRDHLFKPSNGARTPRNPLAALRNPAGKVEFTPLMKSATTNRTRQVNGLLKGGIATPAALKKGFELGGTPLPEASTFNALSSSFSESGIGNQTPVPQADSSDVSTPMALRQRPEGEFDDGKGLTLREQEAVSVPVVVSGARGPDHISYPYLHARVLTESSVLNKSTKRTLASNSRFTSWKRA